MHHPTLAYHICSSLKIRKYIRVHFPFVNLSSLIN